MAGLRSRVLESEVSDGGVDFMRRSQKQQTLEKLQVENLVAKGVIDPVLVVKNSLLYGSSIASILLTADCAILQEPDRRQSPIHEHEEFHI